MRKMRQVERTDRSDQLMVDAAIALMLERGISGLRLSDVGLRAGYSRGLAAMRFGTQGKLLRRVAERLGERWIGAVTEAVGQKRGLAAIYAAIDTEERFLTPPAAGIRVQYLILFNSLDPGAPDRLNAARVMVAQRRDLARWLRDAVEAGEVRADLDPEAEAQSILGALIGIIFQSLLGPDVSPSEMCAKLKAEIGSRLARPARPPRRRRRSAS